MLIKIFFAAKSFASFSSNLFERKKSKLIDVTLLTDSTKNWFMFFFKSLNKIVVLMSAFPNNSASGANT